MLAARAAAARYDALYDSRENRSRWRSPLLIMALVFFIGTCAGLIGARLVNPAGKTPPLSPPAIALAKPAATSSIDREREATALRGIRPSELPYDGRGPQAAEEISPPPTPKAAADSTQQQILELEKELEKAEALAAKAAVTVPRPAPPPAAEARPPAAEVRPPAAKPAPPSDTASAKRAAAAPRKPAAAVAESAPPPKTAKRTEATSRKTASAAKDREIERIRRQADEEMGRKSMVASSSGGSGSEGKEAASRPSRLQQVGSALAQCDRRSNIILREHCRWQVCNGMWGRNGCPSYSTAKRNDPHEF